jgi:hypothetical protein
MDSLPYRLSTHTDRPPLRRRAGGLLLAIILHALVILLLLTLAPPQAVQKQLDNALTTFNLSPEKKSTARSEQKQASAAPRSSKAVVPPKPTPRTPPIPTKMPFLEMDRDQLAAADIAKMPSRADDRATGNSAAGASAGQGSASAYGPGEGPGGVQLFNADWYRRPTDAELATYLPADAPPNGWGEVACKTVEHYHVENCQPLGESPLGSGYARAVRLAAWQFLVLPPRVDGRILVGSWVRIRIDYTQRQIRN